MSKTTPTARRLQQLRDSRFGWSNQKLADAIYDATGVRMRDITIARTIDGKTKLSPSYQKAIDAFLAGYEQKAAS